MQVSVSIVPLDPSSDCLGLIAAEARAEGLRFVDRLIVEARSGKNRFDGEGEIFLGVYADGVLIACGGVNADPYTMRHVGRLRHLYILSAWRRLGLGRRLVRKLCQHGNDHFPEIRLRTPNKNADAFYESIGFQPVQGEHVTHAIVSAE